MIEPTRQQILDDIIAEAHEEHGGQTSEVKRAIVASLHDLEGSGVAWVGATIDACTETGAARMYADWRRRSTVFATTRKGTELDMPAFGAVTERDGDVIVYVQVALEGMSLDNLRERRDRLSKQRNTLSREIQLLSDLIAVMEADPSLLTAGDALERLAAA